ncbi:AAA family ATPase [Pelagibius sp.]|uniref:AAA family ATPase n=1 Tax=Pelagibius sp. TaxID=1931238 RepID=UPI003B5090B8
MIRLHITGASGSGTSTLGHALSEHLGVARFDTDEFYWQPGDPPYTLKRPVEERLRLLNRAFAEAGSWVLSGSIGHWGAPLIPQFDLVIFLSVPTGVRLERLRRREVERYGNRIEPGGDRHDASIAFLEWAAEYEIGPPEGRSREMHETWLETLPCPVLRLEGDRAVVSQRADSLAALARHGLPV